MPYPNESPLVLLDSLVCSMCLHIMRRVLEIDANGKFKKATHYCDTCKYGYEITRDKALHPANGRDVPWVAEVKDGAK